MRLKKTIGKQFINIIPDGYKIYKNIYFIFLAIIAVIVSHTVQVSAEENVITVYYDRVIGEVNNKIYGSSFMGLDPIKEIWPPYYYKRADYGTGIWNPKKNEPVREVMELAKDAGINVVRFYTGNYFNWKNAIGKKRKHFLFGIDEFMRTMEVIGAEPVFVVSYYRGDEQDAADLVEYLNAPYDGKHTWADTRAANGHPEPYGVRYFELGNEVFVHKKNKRGNKKVLPEDYAAKYLAYQKAMNNVDDSVALGLNLHHYDWRWDYKVLEGVGNNLDFVVWHAYPPKDLGYYASAIDYKKDDLFKVVMGSIDYYTGKQFVNMQKIIEETTGKDNVYFAITEYNIGLAGQEPPYRFSLAASLVNAELVQIFMKPENKVLIANNWNFIEESWGMIKLEEDYTKHDYRKPIKYTKRPNYYVYELYNKHFGDVLIYADVNVDTYNIGQYKPYMRAYINKRSDRTLLQYEWLNNKWINRIKRTVMRALYKPEEDGIILGENLLPEKWEIRKARGITAEHKNKVLKIHFEDPDKYNYYHSVKHASVEPNTYYKLSGYIKTENLIDKNGVFLSVGDGRGWTKTHSAVGTTKINGTVDWQYVEVVYKTLPDATSVKAQAGRIGKEAPLKGIAYFKEVRLQKYIPTDMHINYLSVNASKNKANDKLYLMVINKNPNEAITTLMNIKGFVPSEILPSSQENINNDLLQVNVWILNGPSVDSTNEEVANNVRVTYKTLDVNKIPFEFTYEPHSLTAIEIVKK